MSLALLMGDAAQHPCTGSAGGAITALANEPARHPAGPAANYCQCQRRADQGWCPLCLLPSCASLVGCPPKITHRHRGRHRSAHWALPADAELVALPPRRVPRRGDSARLQPVSLVEGRCWRGWVLQEGEGVGPAARRGKGRRQLPWKQKIKSMHPASGFGGKLGMARAGSLRPQGGWCSLQPRHLHALAAVPRLCRGAGLALAKS